METSRHGKPPLDGHVARVSSHGQLSGFVGTRPPGGPALASMDYLDAWYCARDLVASVHYHTTGVNGATLHAALDQLRPTAPGADQG